MRRALAGVAVLLALAGATHASAAEWHSQQPIGEAGGYPLLGEVGDVECWAGEANRCVLITAGNSGVEAGVFAYDGSGWYRYSTVCGGHQGRIAWSGANEFWTISDQQAGQATNEKSSAFYNLSLCHFKDGQVVASYGEPVGVASSYRHMFAAACAGPSDCWFAGERLTATTSASQGAFHLHWNGSSLSRAPASTVFEDLADPGRDVTALAHHEGSFYEGVDVKADDLPSVEEEEEEALLGPSFVHRLQPGSAEPFKPLFGAARLAYGGFGAEASELQGVHLSGEDGEDLWAVAGSEGSLAKPIVLRVGDEGPHQVTLTDPEGLLAPNVFVTGLAALPGEEAAWVAFRPRADPAEFPEYPARLTRVAADGTVGPEVQLPLAGDEPLGEPLGRKGIAGPVTCVAAEQCWLATRFGWLFHLGADPAPQADPAMHALITSRPADNSLPVLPPLELPEDDSGAEEGASEQIEVASRFEPAPKRTPALLTKIRQRLIGRTAIELRFSLRARARVRLVAWRKGHRVASTKRRTMGKGRRRIRLRLDPQRWPTRLDLQAHRVKKRKKGST